MAIKETRSCLPLSRRFVTGEVELALLDADLFTNPELHRQALRCLSPDRRRKINAYRYDKDKRLSLAAGVLLTEGLAHRNLLDAPVTVDANGKPILAAHPETHFNLAHCGHWAVCAWAPREVGVDIEVITPIRDALIKKACTPKEQAHLKSLTPQQRRRDFFRLWTAKESYVKATGQGLAYNPQAIEIDVTTGARLIKPHREGVTFEETEVDGCRVCLCLLKEGDPITSGRLHQN